MVLKRPALFSPEWQAGLKGVPEQAMVAIVEIINPNTSGGIYDPVTNKWLADPEILYSGKARVQPLRSASRASVPGASTTTQTILISLPVETLSIPLEVSYVVRVTNGGLNPDLLRYQYRIKELMDSSNPIERTLQCEVDQEA